MNVCAILLGSALGLLLRKGLPQRLRDTVMQGLGLCVILIGLSGAIGTADTMCVIISIVVGGLVGAAVNIEKRLENLGNLAQRKLARGGDGFARGFVTASLVYCVGAMAIMGALDSGLKGDHATLIAKSAPGWYFCHYFCQHPGAWRCVLSAGGVGLSGAPLRSWRAG